MVHIIFLTKFIFMLRKRKLSSKEKELNIIIQGVLTVKQKTFYFLLRVFFNFINSIQNFYRTVTFWYMIFYIFVYLYEFKFLYFMAETYCKDHLILTKNVLLDAWKIVSCFYNYIKHIQSIFST